MTALRELPQDVGDSMSSRPPEEDLEQTRVANLGELQQELLRLHNFTESASAEKQIQGIVSVAGKPYYSRIESPHGLTFARGHRVEIDFDEEEFAGGGVYLLASVLERFLGAYVSLNSFSVLAARTRQLRYPMREWKPRSGAKSLL